MIDTAAGSCGFPVHTIFYVWKKILNDLGLSETHLFTLDEKPARCIDYVNNKIFGIDFDEKSVRVARTLNLIAGDGQTNVMHLNTLDYDRWYEKTGDDKKPGDSAWIDTYNNGWKKLRKLRTGKDSNRNFEFDILMANPPFAGDIKESRILAKYELGKNAAGKYQAKVGRDILFIERNLDFLKPGGRMAIVLPQGRFNNSSDKQIREFIAERCRILAVVGLHGNTFKPHTGTKTSVLFVQKWDDKLCPKCEDYPIFFATMQEPSKDNSGEKIYLRKRDCVIKDFDPQSPGNTGHYDFPKNDSANEPYNEYVSSFKKLDEFMLDEHGHLIVKHDLFNHDGLTCDGIAEAFAEFAKKERLSFF
jgi:type I restriction enzyme M protein